MDLTHRLANNILNISFQIRYSGTTRAIDHFVAN